MAGTGKLGFFLLLAASENAMTEKCSKAQTRRQPLMPVDVSTPIGRLVLRLLMVGFPPKIE
jgi:hypothetical protein